MMNCLLMSLILHAVVTITIAFNLNETERRLHINNLYNINIIHCANNKTTALCVMWY